MIVGAGFVGVPLFNELSKRLPETTKLVLISPRKPFIHLPAACRVIACPSETEFSKDVLIPFTERFRDDKNSARRTVFGKVKEIVDRKRGSGDKDKDQEGEGERYVVLESGEKVEYTYLVLAPGCSWDGPLGFPDSMEETQVKVKEWHEKFEKAKDIVLVGGGGVAFGA